MNAPEQVDDATPSVTDEQSKPDIAPVEAPTAITIVGSHPTTWDEKYAKNEHEFAW